MSQNTTKIEQFLQDLLLFPNKLKSQKLPSFYSILLFHTPIDPLKLSLSDIMHVGKILSVQMCASSKQTEQNGDCFVVNLAMPTAFVSFVQWAMLKSLGETGDALEHLMSTVELNIRMLIAEYLNLNMY